MRWRVLTMPALLISRSIGPNERRTMSALWRTECSDARLQWTTCTAAPGTCPMISSRSAFAPATSRHSMTTVRPAIASSRLATRPMPCVVPVMTAISFTVDSRFSQEA
jgi:hypothetical protein